MASSLSYFFRLQLNRMHRTIRDWGIYPWLVYIGIPLLFVGGSVALFSRTAYANWLYVGIAVVALLQTCSATRLRFLKQVFDRTAYWRIRLIEHALMILPFVLFLLFKGEGWFGVGLVALALLMLPVRIGMAGTFMLPTPFSTRPFEFAIGFRNSVGVLLIAMILLIIGICVGNGYLSLATLPFVVFVCANFYGWNEPPLYVWIYRLTPRSFLVMKVGTALRQLTVVLLPMALAVGLFFPDQWLLVLGISVAGYGYLALAVVTKYAAFPAGVSIPQGFVMVVSFVMPPLLLVSLPYFFRRAKDNMSLIL